MSVPAPSSCQWISGPVTVRAYDVPVPGGAKRVYVMGDEHFSYQNLCRKCDSESGCCNVVKFIENSVARVAAPGSQGELDVFLELPYVPRAGVARELSLKRWQRLMDGDRGSRLRKSKDGRWSRRAYLGIIAVLYHKYHKLVYNRSAEDRQSSRRQSKQRNNVRFHYADAREEPNVQLLLPILPESIHRTIRSCAQLKQLMQAFLFSDNFVRDVAAIGCSAIPDTLSSLSVGGPRIVHKVAKQFLSVPEGRLRSALRAYLDDRIDDAVEVARVDLGFDSGYHVITSALAAARQSNADLALQRVPHLSHGLIPLWLLRIRGAHDQLYRRTYKAVIQYAFHLLIMDAYLMGRLLRYCTRGGECIVYAGNTHAEYYCSFFQDYLGLKPVICQPMQQIAKVRRMSRMMQWDSNLSRCIHVAKPPTTTCKTVGKEPLMRPQPA